MALRIAVLPPPFLSFSSPFSSPPPTSATGDAAPRFVPGAMAAMCEA